MPYQTLDLLRGVLKRFPSGLSVADLGCGPSGGSWWSLLPPGSSISAFDLYYDLKVKREGLHFYRKDATTLYRDEAHRAAFDLVAAEHVFEHVPKPDDLAASASFILKPGGFLHVGIPDATNFTDRFYHLIHRDSGGHVSQFSKDSFTALMERHGLSLVDVQPWPDDWLWLEKLFDIKYYNVQYFTQEDLVYISNVFRKELTPEKGYIYGWEYLFEKKRP